MTESASGNKKWSTTVYKVETIQVHPKYGKTQTMDNDIAKIGLKRPVPKYIKFPNMATDGDLLSNCKSAGKYHFPFSPNLSSHFHIASAKESG